MKRWCPTCQENGDKSVVRELSSVRTLMYVMHFWDEDGYEHHHDPNKITTSYSCNKGHNWSGSRNVECPVSGCDWNK